MKRTSGLLSVLAALANAVCAAECSPALTNGNCTIYIDREAPSSPLPIKAEHGATVTIHVSKRPLDKITFDATFVDIQTPDPVNAILAAFSPSLKSVVFNSGVFAVGGGQLRMHVDNTA